MTNKNYRKYNPNKGSIKKYKKKIDQKIFKRGDNLVFLSCTTCQAAAEMHKIYLKYLMQHAVFVEFAQ